jgi:hypothetical protein
MSPNRFCGQKLNAFGPVHYAPAMTEGASSRLRMAASVVGSLRANFITIILGPDFGQLDGGTPTEMPINLVPFDLRLPNGEFIVVLDRSIIRIVGVERTHS